VITSLAVGRHRGFWPPQPAYRALGHDGVGAELAGVFYRPGEPVPAYQRAGVGGERAGRIYAPQRGAADA
jgi:hypothetical protein